jgi:5'-deoxynucleotidase
VLNIKEAINGTLRRMHHVRRYSSVPAIHPENVAEHSWQVAMLSYLIANDLYGRIGSPHIDLGKLLSRALVHDISESMSGDIIRSFKHGSAVMRDACNEQDWSNVLRLCSKLEANLHLDFKHAKASDPEGEIVSLADLLCVVSYCAAEKRLGNDEVDFIAQRMYEEDLRQWHRHKFLGRYVDGLYPTGHWMDIYKEST